MPCLSRSLKVIGTDTDRSTTYDFLILLVFHSNSIALSRTVSKIKGGRPICQIFPPSWLNAPLWGVSSWNFVTAVALEKKTEWCCYQNVKKRVDMSIRLDKIPALDRRTDGRIFHNNIALCMHCMQTRDKKMLFISHAQRAMVRKTGKAMVIVVLGQCGIGTDRRRLQREGTKTLTCARWCE